MMRIKLETRLFALAAGLIALSPGYSLAAPAGPEGLWRTPVHHGVVEIYDCGDKLCARIVTSDILQRDPDEKDVKNRDLALRDRPLKGLTVMWDFKGGPTDWKGGTAYNPQDGGTYHGSLKLVDAEKLSMTGCIVFPLCQSQTWTRIH
jgi:uncharacterized protein (DUF2147 family)